MNLDESALSDENLLQEVLTMGKMAAASVDELNEEPHGLDIESEDKKSTPTLVRLLSLPAQQGSSRNLTFPRHHSPSSPIPRAPSPPLTRSTSAQYRRPRTMWTRSD